MPDDMDWAFLPANRKSADYEALLNVFLDTINVQFLRKIFHVVKIH